ncbi:MAG: hypothetical protein WC799_00230 [Desulfobacteraceae bacterium]|jgi:hypothetical protein
MNKNTLSTFLLVLSLLLVIGSILTLIPYAGASKLNYMGYRSICTFSPVSTAIMLFLAYSGNGYRAKLKERESAGA